MVSGLTLGSDRFRGVGIGAQGSRAGLGSRITGDLSRNRRSLIISKAGVQCIRSVLICWDHQGGSLCINYCMHVHMTCARLHVECLSLIPGILVVHLPRVGLERHGLHEHAGGTGLRRQRRRTRL